MILVLLISILFANACIINDMIGETYMKKDGIESVVDIELDEGEIKSIGISDEKMEKSYNSSSDISHILNEVKDAFKPFYIEDIEEL